MVSTSEPKSTELVQYCLLNPSVQCMIGELTDQATVIQCCSKIAEAEAAV